MSKIELRKASSADVETLETVVHQAYRGGKAAVAWKNEDHIVKGPRITQNELEALLQSDKSQILVVEVTGESHPEVAGCVLVDKHGESVHIGMLAVSPDFQNLGLGKTLVLGAETFARENFDCQTAKMFVLNGRDELLDWYKRLGYEKTGETEAFPTQTGSKPVHDDAHLVVISKTLSQ